jgi:hypothetical protein
VLAVRKTMNERQAQFAAEKRALRDQSEKVTAGGTSRESDLRREFKVCT